MLAVVLERPLGAPLQAERDDRRGVAKDIEEAIWSRVDDAILADAGHKRDRARDDERAQDLVAPVGSNIGEADVDLGHAGVLISVVVGVIETERPTS
jgi:hypothetical protein